MRKVLWAAALLIAVTFGGCIDSGDDLDPGAPGTNDGSDDPDSPSEDQVRNGEVPASWEVGHTWTYSTSLGDDVILVVSEETEDTWVIDTPSEELAWFHARENVSYLGAIGKDHLSGSQDDGAVKYFDFPLEEGEEWTTTWDGVQRRIVTTQANETFRFEAYEGDHLAVEYDYDPEVGWFTEMTFHPIEEDGPEFSMDLRDHDTNWSGELVRWDAEPYFIEQDNSVMIFGAFQVAEGTGELWSRLYILCDQDAMAFQYLLNPGVIEPEQEYVTYSGTCTAEELIDILESPAPGGWQYTYAGAGPNPDEPTDSATHYEVEAWGRTLETLNI